MRMMSPDEAAAFLSRGTRTGKLATVRVDSRPYAAPIWFVIDSASGDILFDTGENTVKGMNLQRDLHLALVVDEEVPPYVYVQTESIAIFSADLDEVLPWSTAIGGRYMGAQNAQAFGKRNAVPSELIVHVGRAKTVGQAEIAS